MSANKLLQSLSEDPQLEKQMGCMAGILQLFDRHQNLSGRRLYGHKRIASTAKSNPASTCGSPRSEENGSSNQDLRFVEDISLRHAADSVAVSKMALDVRSTMQASAVDQDILPPSPFPKNSSRASQEQPRMSLDMSSSVRPARTLDSSRSLHEGRVFHDAKGFSRKQHDIAERVKGLSGCKEFSRFSTDIKDSPTAPLDIRDVVRASFMKEAARISLDRRVVGKESSEVMPGIANVPRPLPRPLPACKETPGSCENQDTKNTKGVGSLKEVEISISPGNDLAKTVFKRKEGSRASTDINESLRLLAKLRVAPWNFVDSRDPRFSSLKEGPRNSYDGREPPRASSVDVKELRAINKLKEAPRLSLDGRLATPERFKDNAKLKEKEVARFSAQSVVDRKLASPTSLKLRSVSSNSDRDTDSLNEGKRSSSNVVARLMGLEAMPTPSQSKSESFDKLSFDAKVQENPLAPKSTEHQSGSRKILCGKDNEVEKYGSPTQRLQGENWSSFSSKEAEDSMDLESAATRADNAKAGQQRKVGQSFSLAPIYPDEYSFNQSTASGAFSEEDSLMAKVPTSKLLDHIEQMRRTDAVCKDVEKKLRMLGSQSSEQDLQSLKQLFQVIQLEDEAYASRLEYLAVQHAGRTRSQRTTVTSDCSSIDSSLQDSVRVAPGSPEWITMKLSEHQGITPDHSRSTSPVKVHKRIGSNSVQAWHVNGFQAAKMSARTGRSRCSSPDRLSPSSDSRSNAFVPRKPGIIRNVATAQGSNGFNNATGSGRKNGTSTRSSSNYGPPNRNPSSQLGISISNGSPCSVAKKPSKKSEKCTKDKVPICIIKDKEESRANLVSLKSQSLSKIGMPSSVKNNSSAHKNRRVQNQKTKSIRNASLEVTINLKSDEVRKPTCETYSNSAKLEKAQINHMEAHCVVAPTSCILDVNIRLSGRDSPSPRIEPAPDAGQLVCSRIRNTGESCGRIEERPRILNSMLFRATELRMENDFQGNKTTDKVLQLLEQQSEDAESRTDKSLGVTEQPSPVSVLDSSFYQEDPSPMASTKRVLNFQEVDVGIPDAQNGFSLDSPVTASTGEAEDGAEEGLFWPARMLPNNSTYSEILECEAVQMEQDDKNGAKADLDYVREVLAAAALARSSQGMGRLGLTDDGPLEGQLFVILESKRNKGSISSARRGEEIGNTAMCNWEVEGREMWRRRLLFDAVNCSLKRRLRGWLILQKQPWIMGSVWAWAWPALGGGGKLLKGVWEDIGRMRKLEAFKRVGEEEGEETEEERSVNSIMEDDALPDPSSERGRFTEEKGEIAMELERLIFKDLIHYTIRDLSPSLHFLHSH